MTQNNNHKRLLAAVLPGALATTFLSAAPGSANEGLNMNGAFEIQLATNSETSVNTKRAAGSFSGLVWKNFGVQADIGVGKHEQYTSTTAEGSLHLYVLPTEQIALGLYMTAEDRRPGNSYFYGIEGQYQAEQFSVEAFAAFRDDIAAETDGTRWGIAAGFDPDQTPRIGYSVGYVHDDGQPLEQHYAYLGMSYQIIDGIDIGIEAGRTDTGANIAAIKATFTFGSGPQFSARDSFSLYPGY